MKWSSRKLWVLALALVGSGVACASESGEESSATGGGEATGATGTGALPATGGTGTSSGGTAGSGGTASTGGAFGGTGGESGGSAGSSGGAAGNGPGTGGCAGTGGGSEVDCSAPMPTGGTDHCGANTSGTAGDLSWSLWSNALDSGSCITTYDATAFGARWSNSGDFLARVGIEWGGWNTTARPYTEYGTITAQFSYNKTGSGGGFSYVGIYGWTNDPCVEYYIVEDSFNNFPFNPWNATQKGTASIDGEEYRLYQNSTTGTGGSRCSGVSSWQQYWSVRQSARQCGTISITEHFDAWTAAGMSLGNMLEAKILVEVGGGTGGVEFPVANVIAE